ncbi:DUF3152 domain-containing protein [Corynebacterium sp. A21]|uniref:DUF3152 domain-containing protein n=1 Tax=Corynebacterium sp. A21 TaxID=3457318 RepID=UPI003FD2B157
MAAEALWVRYARDLGWRAYAIPVLAVITIWVLVDIFTTPEATPSTEDAALGDSQTEVSQIEDAPRGPNPADSEPPVVGPTELPPGGAFTEHGAGTYRVIGLPGLAVGQGQEQVVRYVIEVEEGVNTANIGGDDALAAMIDATLSHPMGWTADPRYRFEHVAPDQDPTMRIQLTSVGTTHELCGNDLAMETSCYTSMGDRVVINESRWVRGAAPFEGDLGSYRQYLISHEVGHGLGYYGHEPCAAEGELAPIMMQQTLSLNNSGLHAVDPNEVYADDNQTCIANPWPYPNLVP